MIQPLSIAIMNGLATPNLTFGPFELFSRDTEKLLVNGSRLVVTVCSKGGNDGKAKAVMV
jgi:hypothetical protein